MTDTLSSLTYLDLIDLENVCGREGDPLAKARQLVRWEEERIVQGIHTYRRTLLTPPDRTVIAKDVLDSGREREYLYFAGNGYLNLSTDPRVIEGASSALRKYGTSTAASSAIGGASVYHQEVQEKLASSLGMEASFLYTSGYAANDALLFGLLRPGDRVFGDQYNHRSIDNAASALFALTRGKVSYRKFHHRSPEDLKRLVEKVSSREGGTVVITDGVFSMEGTLAPLRELEETTRKASGLLIVDDAHGVGLVGKTGRGSAEVFGVSPDLITGSLAKALGSTGGFVAGSKEAIAFLEGTSNGSIFSTYLSVASVGALDVALDIIQAEPERRQRVLATSASLRDGFRTLGLQTSETETAIVPLVIEDPAVFWTMSGALNHSGIYVNSVLPPAVPSPRFRFSLTSNHRPEDVERVLEVVAKVGLAS